MRIAVLTAAGCLVAAGTVIAVAQERPRRAGRPDRAAIEAELGLSADQSAQIRKLRAEERKRAIRQRADLAIARLELQELMDAPTVDDKAVAAKVRAVSDLQAAALKARTDHRLAMRRTLSPEQHEKMRQLMRQRRAERGPRPGRGLRLRRPAPGGPPVPPGGGGPWWDEEDEPEAPPEPEP